MEDLSTLGVQLSENGVIDGVDDDELNSRIVALGESSTASFEVGGQEYLDELNLMVSSFSSHSQRNKLALVEVVADINAQILDNLEKNAVDEDERPKIRATLYFCQQLWEKAEYGAKGEVKAVSKDDDDEADDGKKKKGKGKGKSKNDDHQFSWQEWRTIYLNIMERLVASDPSHLWSMSIIPEIFLVGIWRNALNLLENKPVGVSGSGHQEVKIRHDCERLVANCVSRFGSTSSSGAIASLSAAMIDSVIRAEHMGVSVANICRLCNSAMINEIMTEFSHMDIGAVPGPSVKHVANFFDSFAEGSPELMTIYFPLVKHLVDSPAHQIRSSLLFSMSIVVMHIHKSSESVDLNMVESTDPAESDDVDCNKRNINQLARVRDSMLDIIVERTHDINYYTRAQVLKIWSSLLDSNAVPVRRYGTVCEIALDRLVDKTASVRKNAVSLLSSLIENNPFSGDLDITTFESNKVKLNAALAARIEQLRATSSDDCLNENTEKMSPEDDPFLVSADVLGDSEVISIKNQLEFCEGGLKLISSIMNAFSKIEEMLKSKTTGDVVEALRFFMKAAKFNVKGSAKCLRLTFSLVWHLDPVIQKECIESFRHVYLTDGAVAGDMQNLEPDEIAKNLIELCKRCDLSEVASMERIIGDLFQQDRIDLSVVQALWNCLNIAYNSHSVVSLENYSIPLECTEFGSIIRIIAMITKSIPSSLDTVHIKILNQYVFSTESLLRKDFSAFKAACQCLQAIQPYTMSSSEVKEVMLEVAGGLSNIICGIFCGNNEEITKAWFGVCEEAMHTLYHIHPSPDKVLGSMIAPLYQSLSLSNNLKCSSSSLARFLYILGQCALSSLVFTERIANEAKKASEKKSKDSKKVDEKVNEVDAMEEEMGMAAAADADHERVFNLITEQQIVYDNILGKFHPLIAFVVANEKASFSNPLLRESAVLALCRYMSVSSILCESYLPLLFTVLNQEQSPAIRTTIMIALGDLAFRFPNSLEPWTAHMYAKLTDSDVNVRHNTLMVLTHLALNDMIKIKGQVSHIVCCLTDSNEAIRDLAALFFIKLSERSNNPVYNLLGDIIASLSRDRELSNDANATKEAVVVAALDDAITQTRTLSAAEFRTTMHFLLSFVKKDKQADGLLQRLLIRIGMAQSNCQRRYLAFCISELQITEKGVKSMIENIKHIKDALYDSEVFELFKLTIAKVKKGSKGSAGADARSAVDEFEHLMEVIRTCASGEDVEAVLNVATAGTEANENNEAPPTFIEKTKTKKTVEKKKTTRKKVTKTKTYDDDDEDIDVDDEVEEKIPTASSRRRKPLEEVN